VIDHARVESLQQRVEIERQFSAQLGQIDCAGGASAGDLQPHMTWTTCRRVLDEETCDRIIKTAELFPEEAARSVGDEVYPGKRQARVRKVKRHSESDWLLQLIEALARSANERHYKFDLHGIMKAPEYAEYAAGEGLFAWHNDYGHHGEHAPRKLTVIIQLSESIDYSGGDLEIFLFKREALPRERGRVLIFPSIVVHQVTPITQGLRRALVAWVGGSRMR
jgi:PKHD-type hydroxylase